MEHRRHAGRSPRAHRPLPARTRDDALDRDATAHRRDRWGAARRIHPHPCRTRRHTKGERMTLRVLWPIMRWPDDRRIETEALGAGVKAEFADRFDDVTDEQWRSCDGIVSYVDVPVEHRAKLAKLRILVTPSVGFDKLDLAAW